MYVNTLRISMHAAYDATKETCPLFNIFPLINIPGEPGPKRPR